MDYNNATLLKEILTIPITALYKTSYLFLFGFLYYLGLAAISWIIDLIAFPFVKKPKRVSVVEECMSEFPFDIVQRLMLARVNIIVEGFYDRVFVSSELLSNRLILGYAGDLIDGYRRKVSGREFAALLHDLPSIYVLPTREDRAGPAILFLPSLIKQYVDFRVIGDLLAQSCRIPELPNSYDFYQKLIDIDDLTRDVAYAIDFFLREPYDHNILSQPPFTGKMRRTLRKLVIPYIDSWISQLKNMSDKGLIETAKCGFQVREARYKLSQARFSKTQGIADLADVLADGFKVNLDQKERRFAYFFKNKDAVNAVKEKLIKELENVKTKLVESGPIYEQITTVTLPEVTWLGEDTLAVLPLEEGSPIVLGKGGEQLWKK